MGTQVAALGVVLLTVQQFAVEELGIKHAYYGVSGRGLWVHIYRSEGVSADERVIPGLGFGRPPEGRCLVGAALAGLGFVHGRADGRLHQIGAGTVVVSPGRAAFESGALLTDGPNMSINVEFDRDLVSDAPHAISVARASSPSALNARTQSLARAIAAGWHDDAMRPAIGPLLADLLDAFRADGFPVPLASHRLLSVWPELKVVGRAVDQSLSQASTIPMLVDVESQTKRSSRSAQRAFPTLCRAWGHTVETFRAHRQRARLGLAVRVLANPGATTELVARVLGFSTPTAFCRAFRQYGLPAPGEIARHFRELN